MLLENTYQNIREKVFSYLCTEEINYTGDVIAWLRLLGLKCQHIGFPFLFFFSENGQENLVLSAQPAIVNVIVYGSVVQETFSATQQTLAIESTYNCQPS